MIHGLVKVRNNKIRLNSVYLNLFSLIKCIGIATNSKIYVKNRLLNF